MQNVPPKLGQFRMNFQSRPSRCLGRPSTDCADSYIDANSAFPGEQSITPNDLLPEALQNPIPQGMGVVFFKSRVRSRSRGETRRSSAHAVHHCPMSLRTLCVYRRVSPKMTDKHEGFEKIFTWQTPTPIKRTVPK